MDDKLNPNTLKARIDILEAIVKEHNAWLRVLTTDYLYTKDLRTIEKRVKEWPSIAQIEEDSSVC